MLDRALVAAGIDRQSVYLTNAVKHFKWVPRGKRRIHRTPNQSGVAACLPWLEAEMAAIEPDVVVLLGATAAKALLSASFQVTKSRGQALAVTVGQWSGLAVATVHPSSILREPDSAARRQSFQALVADLRVVASLLPG